MYIGKEISYKMNRFVERVYGAETGKLHVFYVGQAGFIIKTPTGKLLGIDLYLADCVEKEARNRNFKRLVPTLFDADEIVFDCLLITHHHRDHFDVDSIPKLMNHGQTKLLMPEDCLKDAQRLELNMDRIILVEPGFVFDDGELKLHIIPCDHGKSAPNAVGVIVSVSGKNIVIVGDSRLRLDRAKIYRSMGKVDMLIEPINGTFGNMNDRDAILLSALLRPQITVPCHYGMFSTQMGNPGRFADNMARVHLPYIFMALGEQYTFPTVT